MPSSIEIFGKEIPIYGICYLLGIFASAIVASLICRRKNLPKYEIVYSAVFTAIGGLVGAKILFILINLKYVIENNIPFEMLMKGGFVFYGGFIGGVLGLLIYTKMFKLKFSDFAGIYATVIPLGHAIGRIGCLFGGCCYGIPYDGAFAITYTETLGNTPLNTPLLPVQGMEAFCLLALFFVLLIIYFKCNGAWLSVGAYLTGYSVIRFVLEYLRYDAERGGLWLFSTSQWISIALFAVGTAVIIKGFIKIKKA